MRYLLSALVLLMCTLLFACAHPRTEGVTKLTGDVAKGEPIWKQHCNRCHGDDGKGKDNLAPDITTDHHKGHSDASFITVILAGHDSMPEFASKLKDQEVADVMAYYRKTILK